MRLRRTGVIGFTLLTLLIAVSAVSAGEITVEYFFERPLVKTVTIDGQTYDRVMMFEATNGGNFGQPALPARPARILIPYGQIVTDVTIESDEPVLVGSGYNLEPVARPFPLSRGMTAVNQLQPNPAVYGSDQPFPQSRYENVYTGEFRGYQILTLKLQPTVYHPLSGDLYYFPGLTVNVTTADAHRPAPLYRGTAEDQAAVFDRVDNDKEAATYDTAPQRLDGEYDLLIITDPTMTSYFLPLKDYHDTTGIITEIHTTDDVGSTDPDDVRDYIRTQYLTDGITYVLIGADDHLIQAKDLYVESWDGPGADIETAMPGDIYFACLDGTYNYDGDSRWGEPGDGEGGGEVDLIAEVYVGRAPVSNGAEAARFVTKTLTYAAAATPYLQDVLMCGEYLGFGGVSDYAGNMMDQIVDGSSADGYTTVGVPSSELNVDYLYDRDWWNNDWPQSEIVSRINGGLHYINHLGHGNETYALKMYSSDVSLLTNTELCFIYSQACQSGHFDGMDCFAEELHVKSDYAAFAVIMNARYGWGTSNTTDGPSQRFDREFWDAVYNGSESKPELGPANHDSKEDNLYRIGEDCMRWCYYEITLFGDPALGIKGIGGITFSYPGGIPQTILPDQTTTFEVQVGTFGSGAAVSGSGQLHYAINGGLLQTVSMTDLGADLYEATLPAISCGDYIDFYVSAEEAINGRQYDPDPASPNHATAATSVVTAFSDDFETDLGWTVSGGQWARGLPTGGGGEYGYPDPSSAYSGTNVYGYNLSGDYANNLPEYHLTSPAIDCSSLTNVHLNFQRWLGVEQPAYDHAYVRVSSNGSTWTTVWENPYEVADNAWVAIDLDISEYADEEATVYIRFTMGTTDTGWKYCGWNIDDLEVTGFECQSSPGPIITTESLPDGVVGSPYSESLSATGGVGSLSWTDKNDDLSGTGLTLSSAGLLSGTPTVAGPLEFTALVTDENLATDEKLLVISVHDALNITTSSLPEGTSGEAYSQTLTATGGQPIYTWVDKNSDLIGTGLSLSPTGVLSGTPGSAGPISFTAMVTDQGSGSDEALLTVDVYDLLQVTTTDLPDWTEGYPYSQALSATGGTGAYTWSDKNGDLAGSGLTLSVDGTLSGTPTAAVTISFTAEVADEGSHTAENPLSILVNAAIDIDTETNLDWTVDIPYDIVLECTGGTGEINWEDKNGDLTGTGLTLSPGGRLSGDLLDTGQIALTLLVTDEVGATGEAGVEFMINPAVSIITTAIPDGLLGEPYSFQFESEGGTGFRTHMEWDSFVLEGIGLSLSVSGLLSGTPTDTGTVSFTLAVLDARGSVDLRAFDLLITRPWMCGDLNDDGNVTLSDISILIDHLYISKKALDIPEAANVNGSPDGSITLGDISRMIDHVYISKEPLGCL